MERYEHDAYGFRVPVLTELESVEEMQYRLRRKAQILAQGHKRTTDWAKITQAVGDHYESIMSEPGYGEVPG